MTQKSSEPIVAPDNSDQSQALNIAWQLYAQLSENSAAVYRRYLGLRAATMVLFVAGGLLAILTCLVPTAAEISLVREGLRASAIVAAICLIPVYIQLNPLRRGQFWLVLRSGAGEMGKEIYCYRTLLQCEPDRHQWLSDRVNEIQRQVLETIGGNLLLQPYHGPLPPTSMAGQADDPGFSDLLADEYLCYRLDAQSQLYSQELQQFSLSRAIFRAGILGFSALGVLLPALGHEFSLWVALTVAISLSLLLWLEVRSVEEQIYLHNQLILELNLIRDRWQGLSPDERTGDAFFHLVMVTERLLRSAYGHPTQRMRQAVAVQQETEGDLLRQVMAQPAPTAIDRAVKHQYRSERITQSVEEPAKATTLEQSEPVEQAVQPITVETSATPAKPDVENTLQRGLPHAFVIMPFGRKQGPDGHWIDFNSIYQELIKPALEEAGFESFRADEEAATGDILTDMFQELLLADLAIADLSIDNANVFYELGIRHVMRKRGVVHIQSGRAYMPFDIFNVRTIPYHCDDSGRPDPHQLEKDKQALIKSIQATWNSNRNHIHSPVFNLLDGLVEPERKTLRTPLATGYWQEYDDLQERLSIAQRQKRIGDVVLLAEEVKNPLIKIDVITFAGKVLKNMGNSALALKQYREGLSLDPENTLFRGEEAYHLNRLQQPDEAIVKLERLLEDKPNNVDAMSYLARIFKDMWKQQWHNIEDRDSRIAAAYDASQLLQKSIDNYLRAYRVDQNDYYPGINALTLTAILDCLAQRMESDSNDPEEAFHRRQLSALQGSVQFCLTSKFRKTPSDPWAALSRGELAICTAENPQKVAIAYKKALTLLWNNKFALQSTLEQLEMLLLLDFRPEYVQAGIDVLQAELRRCESQSLVSAEKEEDRKPAQVFLFSGHMIDSPTRPQPRFPAAMEPEAQKKLEATLDNLNACSRCIGIVAGIACGGDILFIEACLRRNMQVEAFLPFAPAIFIENSVSFAGDNWVERFYDITNHPNVTLHLQPERLGPLPNGSDAYARNNRWALYSTLMYDIKRVRLILLWNGKGGDGPGGTADMRQQVRQLGGVVEHLDTMKFDYWHEQGIEHLDTRKFNYWQKQG